MPEFKIYCGRHRSTGRAVSDAELRAFITQAVESRFESFTVQHVEGHWRATSEPSIIIGIVGRSRGTRASIAAVAREYKNRFNQEAVLVVRNEVTSTLI
jgi:Protein of unknown function (DUF3574)